MNLGVMQKAAIESWPSTLMCGALLLGVEAVVAYVIPMFQSQFTQTLEQFKFVQTFVGAMLGVKVAGQLGPDAFMALPWVHPVVLALVWAHALFYCTRTPAGEIDRGTADVTFTLPVTRWGILRDESIVWLAAGIAVLTLGLIGNVLGSHFVPPEHRPRFDRTLIVLVNLFCLYLAVGGLSWLVSASSNRRGPALTVIFVILLVSFLLNFLAPFWEPADRLSFLSVMTYYRPLFVLRDGNVPWSDINTLLALAAVEWIAAGIVFNRRDVCTV